MRNPSSSLPAPSNTLIRLKEDAELAGWPLLRFDKLLKATSSENSAEMASEMKKARCKTKIDFNHQHYLRGSASELGAVIEVLRSIR